MKRLLIAMLLALSLVSLVANTVLADIAGPHWPTIRVQPVKTISF